MGWVFFFDGDCAFCSASVRRIARFDSRGRIAFSPLQGELSREMGFSRHAGLKDGTMVVLRESDGKVFLRSDALLELAHAIGGPWRMLGIFKLIPHGLRDMLYRWMAGNRHRLAGGDRCSLGDPVVKERLRP